LELLLLLLLLLHQMLLHAGLTAEHAGRLTAAVRCCCRQCFGEV
jgi:hypothetical protein